jgi:hypothetical protein
MGALLLGSCAAGRGRRSVPTKEHRVGAAFAQKDSTLRLRRPAPRRRRPPSQARAPCTKMESAGVPFASYNLDGPPRTLTGNFVEERALHAATGSPRRKPATGAAAGGRRSGDDSAGAPDGSPRPAAGGAPPAAESAAERAANAAQPATFERVIEHGGAEASVGGGAWWDGSCRRGRRAERRATADKPTRRAAPSPSPRSPPPLRPPPPPHPQPAKAWTSHTRGAHAAPEALRDALPGTYRGAPVGPKEAAELRALRAAAAAAVAADRAAAAAAAAAERGACPPGRLATTHAAAFGAPPLEGLT